MLLVIAPSGVVAAEYPDVEVTPAHTPAEWDRVTVTPATRVAMEAKRTAAGVPDPRKAGLMTAADLRLRRAPQLAASDWTQMPDSPLTGHDRAAWATYRQALRDITSGTDPNTVAWPTPPSAT